jgi:hypothetical protein
MDIEPPLRTAEEAKHYFHSMGCSHFHMSREWPARYAEYCELNISKEVETEWTAESISTLIAELKHGEVGKEPLWTVHSRLVYLVVGGQLWQFLEEVYEASCAIQDSLSKEGRLLVAETIVGRQDLQYRSSLIFQSHDSGRTQLAVKFAELVRLLAGKLFKAKDKESRRQELLSNLTEAERLCNIQPH